MKGMLMMVCHSLPAASVLSAWPEGWYFNYSFCWINLMNWALAGSRPLLVFGYSCLGSYEFHGVHVFSTLSWLSTCWAICGWLEVKAISCADFAGNTQGLPNQTLGWAGSWEKQFSQKIPMWNSSQFSSAQLLSFHLHCLWCHWGPQRLSLLQSQGRKKVLNWEDYLDFLSLSFLPQLPCLIRDHTSCAMSVVEWDFFFL